MAITIDENELRKHDRAMTEAVEYFRGFVSRMDMEYKSEVRNLEGAALQVVDLIMNEAGLPEDWE